MTRHRLRFFFPDALDQLDPSFDFEKETRSPTRVRQRDDVYAHEVFSEKVYDGMLVSKGIVDRVGSGAGRYTVAQRRRFGSLGGREFLRLTNTNLPIMGDCGAFTYVKEAEPPFSVDEVIDFYIDCDADFGLSVDHVILTYKAALDKLPANQAPAPLRARQALTLELATEFLRIHQSQGLRFTPVGVAQGWSPTSYASAVVALQKMGYTYIALGGLVPLKTKEILATLSAVSDVRAPETGFHLLGITRLDAMPAFADFGVVSFDSTSPLRKAFKDDRDNYYTPDRTYMAIRVPQVGENTDLKKRIAAGEVSQDAARGLERACLDALKRYAQGDGSLDTALEVLRAYEKLHHPDVDLSADYAEVLRDRPWTKCPCKLCCDLGHHVMLLRGAERNRSRGFHNVWTFYNRLLCAVVGDTPEYPLAAHDAGPPVLTDVLGDTAQPSVLAQDELRS